MAFEIFVPTNLAFQDYLAVCQCARTLADGYDRKVWPSPSCYTTSLTIAGQKSRPSIPSIQGNRRLQPRRSSLGRETLRSRRVRRRMAWAKPPWSQSSSYAASPWCPIFQVRNGRRDRGRMAAASKPWQTRRRRGLCKSDVQDWGDQRRQKLDAADIRKG